MKLTTRTFVDPLDLGWGDAILGQDDRPPDLAAEDAAMQSALNDYLKSVKDFENTPVNEIVFDELGNPVQLGPSELSNIKTDPRYAQYEQDALAALAQQSKDGLSERDKADLARMDADLNRQHAGKLGAIRQNMMARGMGGSGLELVASQQAAQDAAQRQALASLEKQGMAQDGRRQATAMMGNMATNLQGRDYNQAANAARAQDAINQFNVSNMNRRDEYNHSGAMDAQQFNAGAKNQRQGQVMDARMQGSQMGYNAGADKANRRLGQYGQEQANEAAFKQSVIQGGAMVAMASDERLKEDVAPEREDEIEAFLSAIDPKAYKYKGDKSQKHGVMAQDLERSKIGSDMVVAIDNAGTKGIDHDGAISALLQAVAHLNKKVGKGKA